MSAAGEPGVSVSPSIPRCVVMGSAVPSILSPSRVLYSAGSRVSSVHVAPSVPRSRPLSLVHPSMSCRQGCMLAFAMSMSACGAVTAMLCVCGQLHRVCWQWDF